MESVYELNAIVDPTGFEFCEIEAAARSFNVARKVDYFG